MLNVNTVGQKPNTAGNPQSPWVYYSLADGEMIGSTTTVARQRAWGDGRVAAPDLTYGVSVGALWAAHRGRAEFPDSGASMFVGDLDPTVAAAFSCADSGVLLMWAHGHFDNDGTDTGAHTILQVGNGGNSKHGFSFQIHQSLRRAQLYGRSGADVSEVVWAAGANNSLTAGVDACIALVVDMATKVGTCYINGAPSGIPFAPTSGAMSLDAADAANKVCVGGAYIGGSLDGSKSFLGSLQRVGLVKFAAMPTNLNDIVYELAMRRGVPGSLFQGVE